MQLIPNIIFAILLGVGVYFFASNVKKLIRNIKLGKDLDRSDQKSQRWSNMIRIALGQSKMVRRPVSGFLHVIVYIGFIIINIEVLEIVLDGLLGTHRLFLPILGKAFYGFLIGTFEVLALLVFVSVTIFWLRRNVLKIKRFWNKEMTDWPKNDGNYILYFEMVLMTLFLIMNTTDVHLQQSGTGNVISQFFVPLFQNISFEGLHLIERTAWWLHICGILVFLNYLYYSKHLHILLAFPNTFYANLKPKGQFPNNKNVTKEVQLMMDPNADPYAAPAEDEGEPEKFGASDVTDLNWVQLMNAYTCTECGRCTSVCPANLTGKELSPRAIMMKTRNRLEEVGRNIDANKGTFQDDGKQLLGDDYITQEEIWACTSCNACVEECPVNIDPLSIIMDMRQYLVMEQSAAPQELNAMMTNVENNGAPWQYSQMDRLNWVNEE
ncbi:4Fe-4S dicluster domain-containing protein [Wenyingzhuangia marina]|uniref:4Fe-4S dicluster domain-containing protein n=1 Tax=Wenyingzhuangia marina TaxID=1195760 RepID=A0A1M5WP33_9FLAO|nr:4Fe-4S dicluster domain-containing protein [Wenyingzhuangia marina]GGF79567.1 Fe-S oxidoreductase [Wenyingzhuangia marina]SHH89142.1 4Fe-4S dicluster domain-containing protein [Wenyingzhuangia marina]